MSLAVLRRGVFAVALVAAAALAGCNNDRVSLTPGPMPTTQATSIPYTAIGASDAVGYGASTPCANPPVVAVPTCPGGTGYVPQLVKLLTATRAVVTLNDLGISGAVLGPDIATLGNMYGSQGSSAPCKPRTGTDVISGDFITNELPSVSGNETLITIFAGGNDTNAIVNAAACMLAGGASQATVTSFLQQEITAFGNDFFKLVQSVRAKAPNANIVVANLPNFAGIPFAQAPGVAAAKPLLQAVSVGIDTSVYQLAATSLHVPVVDLLCDPSSYDPNNFYVDGFHPDDAGYLVFAQRFFAQIAAAAPAPPKTSCPQMTLVSAARMPLGAAIPNFDRR